MHSPDSAPPEHPLRVLLVHGLGRTPVSCRSLARSLRRTGCATESFVYAAFAQSFDAIVARLVRRLESIAARGQYAVVGHSLGGVLLRAALPRLRGPAPRHLVMLGTPNRPPRTARLAAGFRPFRWIAGECGTCLANTDFYRHLPEPSVPYTVIAGTRGLRGRWSPFGADPNDGLVAVEETRVRDDDPVLTLPVAHTFMMRDRAVQAFVKQALGVSPAT